MGKKSATIPEDALILPGYSLPRSADSRTPSSALAPPPIVDTHTHLVSTFSAYRTKYPNGKHLDVHGFVRAFYPQPRSESNGTPRVTTLVDVHCDAPVMKQWKDVADSAINSEQRSQLWCGIDYYFVIGVHPHNAAQYDDLVEQDVLEAASHPRCVGMGEMGLDYHYDNSPRLVQQEILIRQLKLAVRLGKPLTIHTRRADQDVERILKAHVPKDHKIHIHCFTDTPELAHSLLEHFPNLYIGITGVITFSSNLNTKKVIENMVVASLSPEILPDTKPPSLRILLETDAPFMTPTNLPLQSLGLKPGVRLPFSHSGMIPWTAQYVAEVATAAAGGKVEWTTSDILCMGAENARRVYGV